MSHMCGFITVKRSGHRILTAGPHMRGEKREGGEEGRERGGKAKQQKEKQNTTMQCEKTSFHLIMSWLSSANTY